MGLTHGQGAVWVSIVLRREGGYNGGVKIHGFGVAIAFAVLIGCGGGGGGGGGGSTDSSTGSTMTSTGGSTSAGATDGGSSGGSIDAIATYKGSYSGTYTSERFDNILVTPDEGPGPSGTATVSIGSTGYTLIKITPSPANEFNSPAAGTLHSDGSLSVSYTEPTTLHLQDSPVSLKSDGSTLTLKYTYYEHSVTKNDGIYMTLVLTKQ